MSFGLATITIGIDPTIEIGPLTLAWHGIMIALGIAAGGRLAARYAGGHALDPGQVWNALFAIALAGMVGARFFYDAEVPGAALAYHPGGLYEVVLGLLMLAVVIAMRERLRRPTMLLATVLALYGGGRFAMFFYHSDTEPLALGLNVAQVSSVVLVACGALLALRARRVYPPGAERSPRRPGRLAGDYVQDE